MRRDFLDDALRGKDFGDALKRLRSAMRSHVFRTGSGRLRLDGIVGTFDLSTRREGLNVLKEWDQAAHSFSRDDIPVLMLDYFARASAPAHRRRRALAILLDFYFLYVLGLLVIRAWDVGDPNENLDRVTGLVGDLQGANGSGQRFVDDAATLLFVATSNFQPDDAAYRRLLDKVWTLDERHRIAVALTGGPVIATHLRWALSAIYERDLVRLREDNAVDYPWLFFSVLTLMREYARLHRAGVAATERRRVTDALSNALTADPWAFVGKPPAPLVDHAAEHAELRALLNRYNEDLLKELETHLPSQDTYSPISLQFNFPHNTLVAMVVLSLLAATPPPNLPLNALLSGPAAGRGRGEDAELLARSVTGYAAAHPELRGDRRVLIVAYNPPVGLRSFTRTLSALRKSVVDRGLLETPSE